MNTKVLPEKAKRLRESIQALLVGVDEYWEAHEGAGLVKRARKLLEETDG